MKITGLAETEMRVREVEEDYLKKKESVKELFEKSKNFLKEEQWSRSSTFRVYCFGLMIELTQENEVELENMIIKSSQIENDFPVIFSTDEVEKFGLPYIEKRSLYDKDYLMYVRDEREDNSIRDAIVNDLRSFGIEILEA